MNLKSERMEVKSSKQIESYCHWWRKVVLHQDMSVFRYRLTFAISHSFHSLTMHVVSTVVIYYCRLLDFDFLFISQS
jgi:hypothetical protein